MGWWKNKVRSLSHAKQSRTMTSTRIPQSSDGFDGDQMMVNGTLYVKDQGRWFPFGRSSSKNSDWHGFRNQIKILPTQFQPMKEDNNSTWWYQFGSIYTDTGVHGTYLNNITADIPIPFGANAIAIKIFGDNASAEQVTKIKVIIHDYSEYSTGTKIFGNDSLYIPIDGSTLNGDEALINTKKLFARGDTNIASVRGNGVNFLSVTVMGLDEDEKVYGGYVQLATSAATMAEISGGGGESGLARGGE